MTQTPIPFWFLRGGTSRGPYFRREDLPDDRETLSRVLVSVVGAGNPRNIDGLGGGATVTTKVAMLSRSAEADVDVDYFFAQVAVDKPAVDYAPTCGNILVGVGPAALEMGLVEAQDGETTVRVRAVNTGALVSSRVQTPGGRVAYEGDTEIAGVPGTAAPIALDFMEVVGGATGAMFPTGNPRDTIEGAEVSCVDVAMPIVIARAADFGLSGHETPEEIDANRALFERTETVRIAAGRAMGLGDVGEKVTPKFAFLAEPRAGGHIAARYLMPWQCHPSLAITGSQCISACLLAPGTVAEGIGRPIDTSPAAVKVEHPAGIMEVNVTYEADPFRFVSAGVTRTARLIARGEVMVPAAALSGAVPMKEAAE